MDRVINQLGNEFEQAWRVGDRPSIESLLSDAPSVDRDRLLYELVRRETALRQAAGDTLDLNDYLQRFPGKASVIESAFGDAVSGNASTGNKSSPFDATTDHSSDSPVNRPDVSETIVAADSPGEMIGRYRIKRLLDEITKLLTTSAQALHHAHELRLIHRDVKPATLSKPSTSA